MRRLRPGSARGDVEIADFSEELKHETDLSGFAFSSLTSKLLREMQAEFGHNDLAIDDAHCAHQRPKLDQYENCLFAAGQPILARRAAHWRPGDGTCRTLVSGRFPQAQEPA